MIDITFFYLAAAVNNNITFLILLAKAIFTMWQEYRQKRLMVIVHKCGQMYQEHEERKQRERNG